MTATTSRFLYPFNILDATWLGLLVGVSQAMHFSLPGSYTYNGVAQAAKISQAETNGQGWHPSITAPTIGRPAAGIPVSSESHLRPTFDITLLAFQMDRTRVATFMMKNDLSNMRFPSLDGISGGIHVLYHHAGDDYRLEMYQRVNEHQVKLWREFLTKMQATNEGERTLLENSMIPLTSSLWDGNAHDSTQLPVVLAGNSGGTIQGARHHDLSMTPTANSAASTSPSWTAWE